MFINTESVLARQALPEDAPPVRRDLQQTLPVRVHCGLEVTTSLQLQLKFIDSRLAYRGQQRMDAKQATQRCAAAWFQDGITLCQQQF